MSTEDDIKLDQMLTRADEGVADSLREATDLESGLESATFTAEVRGTLKNL